MHSPTINAALDHEYGVGEPGLDAVPFNEVVPLRWFTRRILTDQCPTALDDLLREFSV